MKETIATLIFVLAMLAAAAALCGEKLDYHAPTSTHQPVPTPDYGATSPWN